MTTTANNPNAQFHLRLPTAEDLHLPDAVKHFFELYEYVSPLGNSSVHLSDGLVLTTGSKREINKIALANEHVLNSGQSHLPVRILSCSEESLFEYADNDRSIIACSTLSSDETEERNTAYRNILRFSPDCVIFGDLLSVNEANAAIRLANRGITVFASIPESTSARAIRKLVNLFPVEERSEIQEILAGGLLGVLNQVYRVRMNQKAFGSFEVLNADASVKRHILNGEFLLLDEDIRNGDPDKMLGIQQSFDSMVASDSEVDWKPYIRGFEKDMQSFLNVESS